MRKFKLYMKLCGICTLSLFVPTTALTRQVDGILAELKGDGAATEKSA